MTSRTLSGALAAALLLSGCSQEPAPGASAPSGSPSAAVVCEPHGVPAQRCPWCRPELVEQLGPCPEHGVPEAFCSRCTPSLVAGFEALDDWCAGHDVPESQCLRCNPELAPVEVAGQADLLRARRAPLHACATDGLQVRLTDESVAEAIGLEVARVERRRVSDAIVCPAEVAHDAARYARLAPRASGVVTEVRAELGQSVQAGDVLAVIESAELARAQAEYRQALALVALWERNLELETRLAERGVSTDRDRIEAETRLAESRIARDGAAQQLRNLGLSGERIASLASQEDPAADLPLTAPLSGLVVERAAVVGEVVDTSTPLFAVADTSRVWLLLDVRVEDVPRVSPGQTVELEVPGLPAARRSGRIAWVAAGVDPRTRTLAARAELDNADGLLRAGMFGEARVQPRDAAPALVVPRDAVQWEGCCNVVFVQRSGLLYEPRKVRLGFAIDDGVVVEQGLSEGDPVVTTGSFLLKTEILKGEIGAGCCEVGPAER